MKRPSEKQEHKQLCLYLKDAYPHLIFTSDGSGLRLRLGQAIEWSQLKSGRGLPDLIILESNKKYHGLCIELKRSGEKLTKRDGSYKTPHLVEQDGVLFRLRQKGYCALFCVGLDEAREAVDWYMSQK